jgi:hypothetical protein
MVNEGHSQKVKVIQNMHILLGKRFFSTVLIVIDHTSSLAKVLQSTMLLEYV